MDTLAHLRFKPTLSCYKKNPHLQYFTFLLTGEKPKLRDIFKELLSLADQWKNIGTLFGIEEGVLNRIMVDEMTVRDRLRAMLSEWLKSGDSNPTWAVVANEIEVIDQLKAQEIRKHCVNIANEGVR